MPFKVTFDNKIFIEPGAYTKVDFSKFQNIPITATFPLILIGTAEYGDPFVPYVFSNSIDLKSVFDRNSDFYKVADIVFSPSNEPSRPTPSQVICIKINENEKDSFVINDVNDGATNIYNVNAKISTRQAIKVEWNFTPSLFSITITDASGKVEKFETAGNRIIGVSGNPIFITTDEGVTVKVGSDAEIFSYAVYPTVGELVNAINNSSLGCIVKDVLGKPNFPTDGLDSGISGNAITSLFYDLKELVNNNSSLISLELLSRNITVLPLSGSGYLIGDIGSDIDFSSPSFQQKLISVLSSLPSGIIVPLFKNLDYSADVCDIGYELQGQNYIKGFIPMLKTFLDSTNSIEGEAPFVAELFIEADNYNHLIDLRRSINSPYIDVFAQEIKISTEWLPPSYQAAQVGAIKAGLPLGTSLTAKKVNVVDVRFPSKYNIDLTKKIDREKLILEGIMFYAFNKKTYSFEIKKGVTSYTAIDNDGYTDPALVLLGLYLQTDFNNYMSQFIGHDISNSPIPSRIQPVVNETALKLAAIAKFEQWKSLGFIVDSSTRKAYSDITVSIDNKVARITANLVLVTGIEWIFTTLFAIPYGR